MSPVRMLFHLTTTLIYLVSIWYDNKYVRIPAMEFPGDTERIYKGRLKFLTIWNMLLQAFFFTVCVLNNFVGTNEKNPRNAPLIRKFKDMLLCSLAFPLSLFVGITFWGLYAIDRELIFPKVLDEFFPAWLNHVMHTNIMVFTIIEMLTSYRKYPKRNQGLTILITFMATYLIWIHILNNRSGRWVYPILEVLNFPARVIFFAASLGVVVGLYIVGEKINNIRWGTNNEQKQIKVK